MKKTSSMESPVVFVYDAMGELAAEYGGTVDVAGTQYVASDMLGSTRMVTVEGQEIRRFDYLPFGQDIPAGVNGRTPPFPVADLALERFRQRFTSKERDAETGLDYFGARYFSGAQGITVLRPNSEVRWRVGALERIQWTHTLGADATFRMELDRDDDGEYEELIAAETAVDNPGKGSFGWVVTGPPAAAARIRVSWTEDPEVADASDVTFQIRPAGAAPLARAR